MRLVVLLLAGALFAGEVGLPTLRPAKDRSKPFPCQDRPCGCASAEDCWRHCCCFSNRQKVAWAREHGVTPPEYVVEAAANETDELLADDTNSSDEPKQHHCCGACSIQQVGAPPNLSEAIARHLNGNACCRQSHARHNSKLEVSVVIPRLARQCRGMAPNWMLAVPALPPSPAIVWSFDWVVLGRVAESACLIVEADEGPPLIPPKLFG